MLWGFVGGVFEAVVDGFVWDCGEKFCKWLRGRGEQPIERHDRHRMLPKLPAHRDEASRAAAVAKIRARRDAAKQRRARRGG